MTDPIDPTLERYLNGDYAENNPDWDSADAMWKAEKLVKLLTDNCCQPSSIFEVGCGSGAVLAALRATYPEAELAGFDIAPDATKFWPQFVEFNIRFEQGDFLEMDEPNPEVILLLDVLEHVGNPWQFLAGLRNRSKYIAIHFPLDLSAFSVLREKPLLYVRRKVGHLHFYTRGLALSLLEESGFDIVDCQYTSASLEAPQRSFKTKIAGLVRRILFALNHDLGARLFGGETLMVLVKTGRGI